MKEGLVRSWDGAAEVAAKKRRNPWGDSSYADLITQAIQASPEKRLTLSQIYDWIVRNVPYFRDQGDTSSSAGWKNSIRHNLSLYTKFKAIKNEPNRSSWWIISDNASESRTTRRKKRSKSKVKKKQNFFGRLPSAHNTSPDKRTEVAGLRNRYSITSVDLSKRNAAFFETTCHIDLYKSDVRMPMEDCNTDNRWFSKSLFKSPQHLSFSYVTTEIDANMRQDSMSASDGRSEAFNRFEMTSFTKGLNTFGSYANKFPIQTVSETVQNHLTADYQDCGTKYQNGSLKELVDELMKELSEITDGESQSSSIDANANLCTSESTTSSDIRLTNPFPRVAKEFPHFDSQFAHVTTPFSDNPDRELDLLNSNCEYSEKYSSQRVYYNGAHATRNPNMTCTEAKNLARIQNNGRDDENIKCTGINFQNGGNELLECNSKTGYLAVNSKKASCFLQTYDLRSAYDCYGHQSNTYTPDSELHIFEAENTGTGCVYDADARQSNTDESSSETQIFATETDTCCAIDCSALQSNTDDSNSESHTFKTEDTETFFQIPQFVFENKNDEAVHIQQLKCKNKLIESHQTQQRRHLDKTDEANFETSKLQPVGPMNSKFRKSKDCEAASNVDQLSLEFMNLKEIDDNSLSNYLDCACGFENYDSDFDVYLQS